MIKKYSVLVLFGVFAIPLVSSAQVFVPPVIGITTPQPVPQTITFAPIADQVKAGKGQDYLTPLATSSVLLTVTFTASGSCSYDTSTQRILFDTAGVCTVIASQAGDSGHLPATSITQTFNITSLTPQTITFDNPGANLVGNTITLVARSSSNLAVSFTASPSNVCDTGEGLLAYRAVGNCTVTAIQEGDNVFLPATSVVRVIQVGDQDGNGNKILDSLELNVATARDAFIPGNPNVTIEIIGDVGIPTLTTSTTSLTLIPLATSTYPVGGFSFIASGGFEGSVTVRIYLDKVYDTTTWTLMKSRGGVLVNGPTNGLAPIFDIVTIGGVQKTRITYSIRNGGEFDDDHNPEDNSITDPVFPIMPIIIPPAPTPPAPIVSSSGGGGGNGPIAGSLSAPVPFVAIVPTVPGQVLGASTSTVATSTTSCDQYLTKFIRLGRKNDSEQVLRLQKFLNDFEGMKVPTNGLFGLATYKAVQVFQVKYAVDILNPWGITDPTGFTYLTTRKKVNELYCKGIKQFPLTVAEKKLIGR